VVGRTWVTSCIAGVCWTAGVMSAITVGATPAHRRVKIVVPDAQTMRIITPRVTQPAFGLRTVRMPKRQGRTLRGPTLEQDEVAR